jgi:TetR/AcrR family transcriptional regulator, mexJK operon transcriptional repressor
MPACGGRVPQSGAFPIAGLWNEPAVPLVVFLGQEIRLSDRTLETGAFKRGPGGRPTREEAERRHRGLIEAAFRLFAEKGWDGTSIDEISRRAGVAKGFIYSRYPDKAALFFAAIQWVMEDAMGTLQMSEPLPAAVEEGLYTFGKRLLDLVLRPEALAFFRLFIAEAPKFPQLGEHFVTRNKLLGLVAGVLSQFSELAAVTPDEARSRAEHFVILVVGIPRTLALLVGREPPEQEARRLRAAIRLFLDGCRARSPDGA